MVRKLRQAGAELGDILAEDDVTAPAAESRLDDHRRGDRDSARGSGDLNGRRMRNPRRGERSCRCQLVVGGDERPRPVEHADARSFESSELPEAGLDPVEPFRDVEAADGAAFAAGARAAESLVQQVKSMIGISVRVEVREPGSIERSIGKAKRVVDKRTPRAG